jgi:hypothetical protein
MSLLPVLFCVGKPLQVSRGLETGIKAKKSDGSSHKVHSTLAAHHRWGTDTRRERRKRHNKMEPAEIDLYLNRETRKVAIIQT